MNLYRVEMSKPGAAFYVAANDESAAARAAEKQWENWDYLHGVKAIKVEMVGCGEQYPPRGNGLADACHWFIVASKGERK
jgi:hypothetical protein